MLVKNYENGYIFPNVIASQNLSMEHNFFQIKVTISFEKIMFYTVILTRNVEVWIVGRNNFN